MLVDECRIEPRNNRLSHRSAAVFDFRLQDFKASLCIIDFLKFINRTLKDKN
jgi:hypothetical protein